ncbi:MAG: polysaccharide pyruvyl transferase family protein [Lachnospiraceae bacterium]|nr:polysaccharide pyruvyl transferase family protein [Lachnospiraceae bacterium]
MKVGILSMQRICNYGSFLQAYGLKCILEELGCEVEFVDYHLGAPLVPTDSGRGAIRKFKKVAETLKSRAPMKEKIRYILYKKNYGKKYFPYLGIGEERNYNPEVDMLVIGSDEVFNCVQDNANVGFSPELFGEGNRAKRLITYAASFGNTTMGKMEECCVDKQIGVLLGRFDAVSVRDANSGAMVEKLTGKKPEYHFDPVLIYDFIGKCEEIPKRVPETDYMIFYGYSGRFSREECRAIRNFAEERKLKIFCIGGVQECCDRFIDCSPFQVIAYFQNARCVVTDTFHGTILSVITKKQFVSFVRDCRYGNNEKLTDLLMRLRLENRRISKPSDIEGLLLQQIDYKNTERIIEEERKSTKEYLERQIGL